MDERDLIAAERAVDIATRAGVARVQAEVSMGHGGGTCEDCGEEIEAARKLAAPFARRCVGCQEVHERRRAA